MFELLRTNGSARRGRLTLAHGVVETPCFMPIATKGAVKTLLPSEVEGLGTQMVLANTYHLLLKPGLDGMRRLGGLHRLMGWNVPILTDSGGYQVFSLAKLNKVTDDFVEFQSHLDGSRLRLTPELSMEMQAVIGSDIAMQLDDVVGPDTPRERVEEAMERSLKWAKKCKETIANCQLPITNLFGIVQGGVHDDLRARSIEGLIDIGFDGYAIGGLSVGEPREDAYRVAEFVCDQLPGNKPRYFMGGGMPEEIAHYVSVGVDMFDCVLPTRNARHGLLFVWNHDPADLPSYELLATSSFYTKMHVTNEQFAFDEGPLDPFCDCPACKTTSRACLRHLFSVGEMLAMRLATIHNVRFYLRMMEEMRKNI